MADDRRAREHQEESQYPPLPGEENDSRPYSLPPLPMTTDVTLPSIIDLYGLQATGRYPPPLLNPILDPRSSGSYSTSSYSGNGYVLPPPADNGNNWKFPPLSLPTDQRASYGADGRDHIVQQHQCPPNPYTINCPRQPSRPEFLDYLGNYRAQQQQQQQAAPRQRASIACKYCRKRKIRCSSYQDIPDGKCTNCKKTGNECIFQSISSSNSTAFIPVSAVPRGVPPGTPLYGAFGQPLAPATSSADGPQGALPSSDHTLSSPIGISDHHNHSGDRVRRSPISMSSNIPPTSNKRYSPVDDYDNRMLIPRRNSPGGSNLSDEYKVMALGNLVNGPPARGPQENNIDQDMLRRLNPGS